MHNNAVKGLVLALFLTLALNSQAFAAAVGYACYRDKDSGQAPQFNPWHAGLVSVVNGSAISKVIHHPGSGVLVEVTFANFINGLPDRGYFFRSGVSGPMLSNINARAKELLNMGNVKYTLFSLVSINQSATSLAWIEPKHVSFVRCDGLVEFCYEYYGIRLQGASSNWCIADPNHHGSHPWGCEPKDQAYSF